MEAVLKFTYTAMTINFDLPVMMFGMKLVNRGWRKGDRQYLKNKATIRRILTEEILKVNKEIEEQAKEGKKKVSDNKSAIKIMLEERKKNKEQLD